MGRDISFHHREYQISMNRLRVVFLLLCFFVGTQVLYAQSTNTCGLMVMAHGGTDAWDEAVETAVAPLREEMPTAIAFGMANPVTLEAAVRELEGAGVECIAVVRLFMSAKSFLHQTEYLLGTRSEPPRFFISHGGHGSHHGGKQEDPKPIATKAEIRLSQEGLLDAPEMGEILAQRALAMSEGSGKEHVLLIAHGPGDDAENEEWLSKLDNMADSIRVTGQFGIVESHTLREDWADKRAEAEKRMRSFVETNARDDGRVLVIPFRLFGFGPYAEVLEGLEYESDGMGLLPHPRITDWIRDQATKTMRTSGQSAQM